MSEVNVFAQDAPKKKRRQNVACDTCKLRRVKCDLSTLLDPSEQASSSSVTLSDLVRAHPEVECTNCKNKGVKCTTQQILQPTKPNKGGRRIDEAKKLFGEGDEGSGSEAPSMRASVAPTLPTTAQEPYNASQDVFPGVTFDTAFQAYAGQDAAQAFLDPLPDATANATDTANTFGDAINFPFDLSQSQTNPLGPNAQSAVPDYSVDDWPPAAPSNLQTSGPDATTGLQTHAYFADGIIRTILSEKDRHAVSTWLELANNRPIGSVSPTPASRTPASSERSTNTTRHIQQSLRSPSPALFRHTPTFQVGPPPAQERASSMTRYISPYTFQPDQLIVDRKRVRDDSPISVSSTASNEDQWKVWSDRESDAMALWNRRGVVQEQLATRTLGIELSRHLVKSYFDCVHPSFPALSPEGFYLEWERAGQQSDLMIASYETLCAVMEAWGARYSDSPVVLDLSADQASLAPKVLREDGTLIPGSQTRAHWGKARLRVCNALVERARQKIDMSGTLRRPSVTGLQALMLYSQLLSMSDDNDKEVPRWMENQMVQATILEQMKLLQLMWDADGPVPTEDGAIPMSPAQARMCQRRLFWTAIVMDAFSCAADGQLPRVSDEELDAVERWLDNVEEKLPKSTFKTLAFFMRCYHTLSVMARKVARQITRPNKKPGTVDVGRFASTIREIWVQVFKTMRDMIYITEDLLGQSANSLLGFSPLSYLTNLRLACPFLLLIIHQTIRDQLDFRQALAESYIYETNTNSGSSQSPPGPKAQAIETLTELHKQSVECLLNTCRSHVNMYKVLLPTGCLQAGALCVRVLIATSQFLAEVPTTEQGYPANTKGGYGWTWANKQAELDVYVQALQQLGWGWADVAGVLDRVHLTMERMRPTDEELAAGKNTCPNTDPRLIASKLEEDAAEARLWSSLMSFWPPRSVPSIIEAALKDLRVSEKKQSNMSIDSSKRARMEEESDDSFRSSSRPSPANGDGSSIMDHLERSMKKDGVSFQDLSSAAQVSFSGPSPVSPASASGNVDRALPSQSKRAPKALYTPLAFDEAVQACEKDGTPHYSHQPINVNGTPWEPSSLSYAEWTYTNAPAHPSLSSHSSHDSHPSCPLQSSHLGHQGHGQQSFQSGFGAADFQTFFNNGVGEGFENVADIELLLRSFTESTPGQTSGAQESVL